MSGSELSEVVEGITGYRFKDGALLQQAFLHASASPSPQESNERLEFLGDAALGFIACELLYESLSHLPEGELTKIKSLVVSRAVCASMADELGLTRHLVVGKGMRHSALPQSVRAAILECLLGAMLLDGGLECVKPFVRRLLEPQIQRSCKAGHHRNFKSVLQQVSQLRGDGNPCYRMLDERGPDHDKAFEVCVEVAGINYESRWARSKRQAEQAASEAALRAMGIVVDGPEGEPEVDWSALGGVGQDPDVLQLPANAETKPSESDSGDPEASAA